MGKRGEGKSAKSEYRKQGQQRRDSSYNVIPGEIVHAIKDLYNEWANKQPSKGIGSPCAVRCFASCMSPLSLGRNSSLHSSEIATRVRFGWQRT
jgi:hypothetical protein